MCVNKLARRSVHKNFGYKLSSISQTVEKLLPHQCCLHLRGGKPPKSASQPEEGGGQISCSSSGFQILQYHKFFFADLNSEHFFFPNKRLCKNVVSSPQVLVRKNKNK